MSVSDALSVVGHMLDRVPPSDGEKDRVLRFMTPREHDVVRVLADYVRETTSPTTSEAES